MGQTACVTLAFFRQFLRFAVCGVLPRIHDRSTDSVFHFFFHEALYSKLQTLIVLQCTLQGYHLIGPKQSLDVIYLRKISSKCCQLFNTN